MSDELQPTPPDGGRVSPSPGPARRPRAPTITIDTSAVQRSSSRVSRDPDHEMDRLSDDGRPLIGDRSDKSPRLRPASSTTPTELRVSNSFDSRESRPTSPHNVSSPTQWSNQNLLAVPMQRSRGQSFASDATGETTSTSDVTYVNTQTPTTETAPKAFGDQEQRTGAGGHPVIADAEALRPDKGTEAEFERENNPFAFTPGQMGKMYNPKSLGAFHAMGGLAGMEKGLRSDRHTGLSMDEKNIEGTVSFEEATAASSPSSEITVTEEPPLVNTQSAKDLGSGTFVDRKRIFSDNRLPQKKTKNIFQLMWLAYNSTLR